MIYLPESDGGQPVAEWVDDQHLTPFSASDGPMYSAMVSDESDEPGITKLLVYAVR